MKYLKLFLLIIAISFFGCRKDDTETPPIDNPETQTLKTHNIKTAGPQYFMFETADTTLANSDNCDISFAITSIYYQTDDTKTWMKISDPVIKTGQASLAKLDGQDFDALTSLPSGTKFSKDSTGSAYVGTSWLTSSYDIKNNVYVISVNSKYYALAIKSYGYNSTTHQISSIKFYYKEIKSGATVDTVTSSNTYDNTYYYSLQNKGLGTDETTGDIYFKGSSLWLGLYSQALVLENKTIDEVTSVPTGTFSSDKMDSYVTQSWYDYNSTTHILTPKTITYIAKTTSGKYAAFKIASYYGADGKSGSFTLNWKWIQ
jgi:hypothetical protein